MKALLFYPERRSKLSKYAALKTFSHRSSEEKLAILRHEMLVPIAKIQGHAEILIKQIAQNDTRFLSEDFKFCVEQIAQAGTDLYEILETLTGDQE